MKTQTPVKPKDLSCLGCTTAAQALLVLPKGYIDKRTEQSRLTDAPLGKQMLWRARVTDTTSLDKNGNPNRSPYPARLSVMLKFDCGSSMDYVVFGVTAIWRSIERGDSINFVASLDRKPWGLAFQGLALSSFSGKVEPIYSGVPGQVSGSFIGEQVNAAMQNQILINDAATEIIESGHSVANHICLEGYTPRNLITILHAPDSPESGLNALAVARGAVIEQIRSIGRNSAPKKPSAYSIDAELKLLVAAQPEKLSQGQRVALNKIRQAVNGSFESKTLLNGDVGSGKTLVFLLAAASIAATTSRRVAVMVPSELVARQIFKQAEERFPSLKPILLVAGQASAMNADNLFVVGTQGLLNQELGALACLVVDEQHKLSVEQRSKLVRSGTHVIESSATPIPRSLALALFDGWTEARIEGYPVAKQINCHLLGDDERATASRLALQHVNSGKKIIFLYPQVKATTKGLSSVLEAAKRLEVRFPGKVSCLHGKLKPAEIAQALDDFRSGRKPIAVSSTVIEVGVDIPDIGCMVVNCADRFGVAQLHQLRGRLVRNGGDADFVMMTTGELAQGTRDRLEAVRDMSDGFALAERDMQLRGFGDVLGEMQSGAANTIFKLARLEVSDFIP